MNSDDQPFQHYTLKHRVIGWVSKTLFDRVVYTQRHGLITGMRRRGGLGWLPVQSEDTAETRFWRNLDLRGMTVYDIGAFQGLLTLYFSASAARVVAYEPSPETRARLEENLRLNGRSNVIVRNLGLGSKQEMKELVSLPLMTGGATVDETTGQGIRRNAKNLRVETVTITTLDQDIATFGLPAPDLMKIDIEGWEAEALRGARNTIATRRPALYLEMHGDTLAEKRRKVADIVDILTEYGYQNIRHVETEARITRDNSLVAAQGHLYAVAEGA